MIILSSINCPTVICSPTVCYFSREKPLVKPTAPRSLPNIFSFAIYFSLLLFSDLYLQKPKNTLLQFICIYFILCSCEIYLSKLLQKYLSFTREGLTTPLLRRVLCVAGAVYVVLLDSPTSSITLVSSLREIPIAAVLHHPFLFGKY